MSVSSFFSTLKCGLIGLLISVLGKASVDYVEKTEAKERDIQNVIDQIIEDSKPILDIIEDAPSATTDKAHEAARDVQGEESTEQEKPSLPEMQKNPPKHPDYKPPKNWDGKKVKSPNGSGSGWPHKNGDVWQPTDHGGTHAPHWDVQHPNGTYTHVYLE